MYYLLLFILYPFSLLPLPVLYMLGDVARVVIFHFVGYRRQVIGENLRFAFPEKTVAERNAIQKEFYRNFCDQWVETLKLISISRDVLNRRCTGNWELLNEYRAEGRNVVILLGHFFNWEWANLACAAHVQRPYAGVYLPLTNTAFDRLMQRIRTRTGALLVSMKALKGGLSQLRDQSYILALIADQNPSVPDVAYWQQFMNRPAPFFRGSAQLAMRARAAVVFAGIYKIRRGYYEVRLETFSQNAAAGTSDNLLAGYIAFLERELHRQPANWLWSHRRWKHRSSRTG